MILSIIQTSRNRKKELQRFINSLNGQKGIDFCKIQYVFVDQEDNEELFQILNTDVDFKYVKYHHCGLSEARNIAIQYVKGNIIAFGDDDAWLDDYTLSQVMKEMDAQIDGVVIAAKNEEDKLINNFPEKECELTYTDHKGALSISLFLRFDKGIKFDENIGVGSPYDLASGEETDYLYTFMERHPSSRIVFKPDIVIRHPIGKTCDFDSQLHKAYSYARGLGYVIKKHPLPLGAKLKPFIRPLGGMIIYALKDWKKCKHSFYLLKGRLEGYNFKIIEKHNPKEDEHSISI